MAHQHTTTAADGTTIAWSRTGSGEPVVLVHGITESAASYDPVIVRLAATHELITLAGLMREIIRADHQYSEAEHGHVDKLKAELGQERFDAVFAAAAKDLGSRDIVKERAKQIEDVETRQVMFGYLIGVDLIPTPDGVWCIEANLSTLERLQEHLNQLKVDLRDQEYRRYTIQTQRTAQLIF